MMEKEIDPRGYRRSADIKQTVCLCPRCGKEHVIYMEWTGRGIPRIYCPACKVWVDDNKELELFQGE